MMPAPKPLQWWTMDKRGEGVAHLVALVKPDTINDGHYDYSEWVPACSMVQTVGENMLWSASLFSTFVQDDGDVPVTACSTCDVASRTVRKALS